MYYLAIDIGASSGRHIIGSYENGRLTIEEMYRFPNGMKKNGAGTIRTETVSETPSATAIRETTEWTKKSIR